MDMANVNEEWDHQVAVYLPEMNSCEEEFFNPHELLTSGGQTTTTAASSQSPISGANPPSLSPSGGSVTGGVTQTGALSPGALSQTSNTGAAGGGGQTSNPGTASVGSVPGGGASLTGGGSGSCCENGRPIMTDPVSGQTVCSCQYDSARLALSGYSRIPTGSVYGTPYPSTDQNPYPSIGVDSSAFYSPLSNPYGLKESGPTTDMTAWTSAGLQPTTGYYPYDPTLAAYGYGAGYDLAARRKNATRESTATLKAWLNEHKKNPYPTKGEKIMLAIITKMTLTQVSTWFANARRRLKKENKMTWEPKNKTDDDDDAMVSDDEKDKDDMMESEKHRDHHHHHHKDPMHHVKSEHEKDDDDDDLTDDDRKPDHLNSGMMGHPYGNPYGHHPAYSAHHHQAMLSGYPGIKEEMNGSKNQASSDCGIPIPATKPKIWSLADTAACKTPPPHSAAYLAHQQQQQQLHHHLHPNQQHHPQSGWMGNYQHQFLPQHPQQQHHQQQQQQQQHLQHQPNIHQNGGGGTGMMNMPQTGTTNMAAGIIHPQQQSHSNQQQSQPQSQVQHQQNMNTIGNFGNSQYTKNYGGFLGVAIAAGQMYTNNNNMNSMQHHPNTPTTPTTAMHQNTTGNLVSQQPHQQGMGFPEIQTDTPPQTPPNMKLPSVVGNLMTNSATPMTGTCYNNNNNGNNSNLGQTNNNNSNVANNNLSSGYGSDSSPSSTGSYSGTYSRLQNQSPIKDYNQHSMDSPHHDNNTTSVAAAAAFKPFFKSQQITNGFVSPV